MPTENLPVRAYTMSDGTLLQKADEMKMFATRDATEFAAEGIAGLAALEAARDAFDALPNDEALAGVVTEAAATKNNIKQEVEHSVSSLRVTASRAHAANPGTYSRYNFEGFSNLTDADHYRAGRSMAIVAGLQMTALSGKGYSPAKLTAFKDLLRRGHGRRNRGQSCAR